MEDVAVSLVVVAGGTGLAVHVGHIMGRQLPLERGDAGGEGVARLSAAQLAGLGVTVPLPLRTLTRLQPIGETNGSRALLRMDDISYGTF